MGRNVKSGSRSFDFVAGFESQNSGAMNENDGTSPPPLHSLGPRVSMSKLKPPSTLDPISLLR